MAKVYFIDEEKTRHIEDIQGKVLGARKRLHLTQEDMGNVVGKSRQQYALDEKNFGNVKYEEVYEYLKKAGYRLVIEHET